MDDDLAAAWAELHDANAALGWFVGRPACEPRLSVPWSMYAFDPKERPKVGHRSREWTAYGDDRGRRRARDGALSAGDRRGASADLDRAQPAVVQLLTPK